MGAGQGPRAQAVLVGLDGDERDAQPCRDAPDDRVGEGLDREPPARRHERRHDGGDGLPPVPGEQHAGRGGPPPGRGQQRGRRLPRGGRPGDAGGAERGAEDVGAQQALHPGRQELALPGHGGDAELQVDPRPVRLPEGRAGRPPGGADEGAAPHLADHEAARGQLPVHAARRRGGDAVPAGRRGR
ncbi:hypothetical protein [Actinomadura hallensis]|uniref:hypothetical protein n=1 Tax=Actinomadura hallensis TaxID=337895 RepID=UPI001639C1F9|nr:hypothetical protein [Actinomadura hallensis]